MAVYHWSEKKQEDTNLYVFILHKYDPEFPIVGKYTRSGFVNIRQLDDSHKEEPVIYYTDLATAQTRKCYFSDSDIFVAPLEVIIGYVRQKRLETKKQRRVKRYNEVLDLLSKILKNSTGTLSSKKIPIKVYPKRSSTPRP